MKTAKPREIEALAPESPFPSLSTARLQLREIVASDAPALLAIHGDREAMKWFGTDPLADLEAAERVIAGFANMRTLPSPGVRWGIVHASPARGSALLGTCGVFRWNRGWRTCLTGYELARHDTRPTHPKAGDPSDPLFAARSKEVTSLWRLGAA